MKKKINKTKVIIVICLFVSIVFNFVFYGLGQSLQKDNVRLSQEKATLQTELEIQKNNYHMLLEEYEALSK